MSGAPAGTPLVLVGAGGFARETAQAVRDVEAADRAAGRAARWRLLGHLDDDPALHGRQVDGVPVLGGSDLLADLPRARVLVCVGSPRDYAVRARLVARLGLPERRYATLVHPTAAVSGSSSVGPGSVLLAHCVLTAAVRVGAHVAVMPHAVLTHDDEVADFATVASGVRLGGGVRLERGAYVGAGALVREGATVGAWSLIGMGSAVLGDVPPGEVWVGGPARRLRAAGPRALAELTGDHPLAQAPAHPPAPAGAAPGGALDSKETGDRGVRPVLRRGTPVI
ncbi:NeuD/PglB/VioB family sugar acetyltransferase [Streptomyces sp. NBC_01190]|uniref:NeuD/PglB/VioB family sugar acetyltransferase n=1 Tax=Streptomyces sp. NBC_01190 TaxID=2903767 RepID=UPI003865A7E6|nr:NeuD/PglB/VioB family sugar acetyltransferase [Streptomyces sp. NBC_01190]